MTTMKRLIEVARPHLPIAMGKVAPEIEIKAMIKDILKELEIEVENEFTDWDR